MKRLSLLFSIVLSICAHWCFSQAQQSFPIELPEYTLGAATGYHIKAIVRGNNFYEYIVRNSIDSTRNFQIRPNDYKDFLPRLIEGFSQLTKIDTKLGDAAARAAFQTANATEDKLNAKALFFYFVGSEIGIGSYDFRPLAGQLFLGTTLSPKLYNANANIRKALKNAKKKAKLDKDFRSLRKNDMAMLLKQQLEQLKKDIDGSKLNVDTAPLKKAGEDLDEAITKSFKAELAKIETDITDMVNRLQAEKPTTKDSTETYQKLIDLQIRISKFHNDLQDLNSKTLRPIVFYHINGKGILRWKKAYTVYIGGKDYPYLTKSKARKHLKRLVAIGGPWERIDQKYSVRNIEIEFNEGYIENIEVIASENKGNNVLKFENNYPIGFSTKRDFTRLKETYLYASDVSGVYSIGISDALTRYEQKHEVSRRDYSPENGVVSVNMANDPKDKVDLYKEQTAKLFELKTFSDFVGFDGTKPNGLIQFEVDKRINLTTFRRRLFSYRASYGFLQFIVPSLLKSKIEDTNKNLTLTYRDQFTNNQYDPIKFTSTLQLKRFENFSTGIDMNLALFDVPAIKSMFYLNGGFRYGRVNIRDSTQAFSGSAATRTGRFTDFGVNTFQVTPVKFLWEIKSDERYCLSLGYSMNYYYLRDNSFQQVSNIPTFSDGLGGNSLNKNIYYRTHLEMSYKPDHESTGRLFFRYQYNWQDGFWNTGFHQAQVGYSVYLTKTLKPDK